MEKLFIPDLIICYEPVSVAIFKAVIQGLTSGPFSVSGIVGTNSLLAIVCCTKKISYISFLICPHHMVKYLFYSSFDDDDDTFVCLLGIYIHIYDWN